MWGYTHPKLGISNPASIMGQFMSHLIEVSAYALKRVRLKGATNMQNIQDEMTRVVAWKLVIYVLNCNQCIWLQNNPREMQILGKQNALKQGHNLHQFCRIACLKDFATGCNNLTSVVSDYYSNTWVRPMVRSCPININFEDSWRRGGPFDRKSSWLKEVPSSNITEVFHHTHSQLPNLLVRKVAVLMDYLIPIIPYGPSNSKEKFQNLLRVVGEDEHGWVNKRPSNLLHA